MIEYYATVKSGVSRAYLWTLEMFIIINVFTSQKY